MTTRGRPLPLFPLIHLPFLEPKPDLSLTHYTHTLCKASCLRGMKMTCTRDVLYLNTHTMYMYIKNRQTHTYTDSLLARLPTSVLVCTSIVRHTVYPLGYSLSHKRHWKAGDTPHQRQLKTGTMKPVTLKPITPHFIKVKGLCVV